jgi:hypothetical protein
MGHDYEMNMKKAQNVYNFGTKKAVDEYFENIYHFKHVINGSCRMIIKKTNS